MPYLGKSPSQGVRTRFQFTPNAGTTSISGADANGLTLSFTDGNYVDVYLNGVMLKAGVDYNTNTANTIAGLSATVASDVVDIVVYDTFSLFGGTLEGNVKVNNGTFNVTGAVDFDSTLNVDGVVTTDGATHDGDVTFTGANYNAVWDKSDNSLEFGDEARVKFGADTDFQIYSSGGHVYAQSGSSSNFVITTDTFRLKNQANNADVIAGNGGGAVELYHNGSKKIETTSSGVTVTGGIANASGDFTLDVAGDITFDAGGGDILLKDDGALVGTIGGFASNNVVIKNEVSDGDVIIQGNDGGSGITALTLDMSAAGAATFNSNVAFNGASALGQSGLAEAALNYDSGTNYGLEIKDVGTGTVGTSQIFYRGSDAFGSFASNSNNFLISSLQSDKDLIFKGNDGGSTITALTLDMSQAGEADFNSAIKVGGGIVAHQTNRGVLEYSANQFMMRAYGASSGDGFITFKTGGGGGSTDTERMRIHSDGSVTIGKSAANNSAAGISMFGTSGMSVTRDGGVPFICHRRTNDGTLIQFRKDDGTVGYIAYQGAELQVGQGNASLQFSNSADAIVPANENGTANDDDIDLGISSGRFDNIFATNGTIQTSDENEKQDIASMTTAELAVGKRLSTLFKTFRWKSKVTKKADKARTHSGIVAQEVKAAFEAEGLDATKYALFCSDTWTNDDGSEQTRMGVRYPELLSFIASYNESRFTAIEARIAKLEGE